MPLKKELDIVENYCIFCNLKPNLESFQKLKELNSFSFLKNAIVFGKCKFGGKLKKIQQFLSRKIMKYLE